MDPSTKPSGRRPSHLGAHIRQIMSTHNTTVCVLQAIGLLWGTDHQSQHEANCWISYIDCSVRFDHGLKHTSDIC